MYLLVNMNIKIMITIITNITECLLGTRYYVLSMHHFIYSYNDPVRKHYYYLHFADEIEAWRAQITG